MLEARLQHATVLRRVFEAMNQLVTEVNLECDETGLKLQAMDGSHVALVALHLEESGFLHYRCDRNRTLGLNLAYVCKVFKLCNNNDSVRIESQDDSEHITFVFENDVEEKVSTFNLRLLALDQDSLTIPEDEEQDVNIVFNAKEYASVVSTMKEFSDSLRVEIDKHGVKFITNGDIGAGQVMLRPREGNSQDEGDVGVEITVNRPVTQTFAVKYLNFFAKAAPLSQSCTLTLTSHRPIEVKFDIIDPQGGDSKETRTAGHKLGRFKFFLAPKMEDNDLEYNDTTEMHATKTEAMETE